MLTTMTMVLWNYVVPPVTVSTEWSRWTSTYSS